MSLDIYLINGDDNSDYDLEDEVFEANITHNLSPMAAEAGIRHLLWELEGVKYAKELIKPLSAAIDEMQNDPKRFKSYNAPNKWGLYKHFVPWLIKLHQACTDYPDAELRISV